MNSILFIVISFLLLNSFLIISNNNLSLLISNDREKFISSYESWFSHFSYNIKSSTAYVVKLDWFPSVNKTQE